MSDKCNPIMKPCPFCGGSVELLDESPIYGQSALHDDTPCWFKGNMAYHENLIELWNNRPLEDALRTDNLALIEQINAKGDTK